MVCFHSFSNLPFSSLSLNDLFSFPLSECSKVWAWFGVLSGRPMFPSGEWSGVLFGSDDFGS